MDEVTVPEASVSTAETRVVLRPAVALFVGVLVGVGVGIAVAAALTKVGKEYGESSPEASVVIEEDDEPLASIVIEE